MLSLSTRIELAGQCADCENFDLETGLFSDECHGCKRYYGDLFAKREGANDNEQPASH